MIKSKLRKIDGVTYNELKSNIKQVLNNISFEKYQNIINELM